jgi:pimeloyl-ACP methyl ester carboxylesterase
VHGFLGTHTHFAPQVSYFSPRHRCINVDLRGHGRSDAPEDGDYRVEDLADDVAFVCKELELDRPLIAGHSLGGDVVAMLGARHPELAGALVIIDAPVLPQAGILEMVAVMAETSDNQELLDEIGDNFYSPYDDPEIKDQIMEENWTAPHAYPIFAKRMAEWVQGQAGPAGDDMVRKWSVPVCLIEAGQMNDIDRLNRLDPVVVVGQTVGTGHYVQLMAPGQVNAMIESFSKMV